MPQFDLAVFPAQIFWLVIFFTILMVYTVSVSVPRMKKLLDERWQKTEGYRIEATRYSDEHKTTLQQVETDVSSARKEAHAMVSETQGNVNRDVTERKNEMLALMKTQMSEAEQRLEMSKSQAVSDIAEHTHLITQEIVSKLLPMGGNDNEIKALVGDKLDLKKVSNGT